MILEFRQDNKCNNIPYSKAISMRNNYHFKRYKKCITECLTLAALDSRNPKRCQLERSL